MNSSSQGQKNAHVGDLAGSVGSATNLELIMSNNDVVVKQQDEIQIFENQEGGISIVQKNWPNDDAVVCFHVEHAEIVAQAIIDAHRSIMEKK